MKTKLHFGILAVLLAFLVTFTEGSTVPNQQIVIEFSDKTISTQDTENAIDAIQNRLQSIGVTHIQIGKNSKGQLRITYHSEAEVTQIKAELFKAETIKLAYDGSKSSSEDFPEQQPVNDYELNISEIKTNSNQNWDFEGTQVSEINQKTDHSNPNKVEYYGREFNSETSNRIIRVAILENRSIVFAIDNLSYKIPEVRAGPMA